MSAPLHNFKTEKRFQDAVVQLAHIHGFKAYHTYDSRRSTPGFPDLVLLRDDILIFAELKTEKGKLSEFQKEWLSGLDDFAESIEQIWCFSGRPMPIRVYLWRPSDWDNIIEILKR